MRLPGLRSFAGAALVLALGACSDSPTGPGPLDADGAPALNDLDGCVSEDSCLLPPIIVVGGGGGDTCDPSLGPCDEPSPGECLESEPSAPDAATVECGGGGLGEGGSGGTGDGSTSPPPASEDVSGDTCYTGDPIIDDPDVSGEFAALWQASTTEGEERGGWIIQIGTGSYDLVPFQSADYGPCGINVYDTVPAGAVSILHTHPWGLGDTTACGTIYTGTPSPEDQAALQQLGFAKGYFLDAQGIATFLPDGGESATRVGRCGY